MATVLIIDDDKVICDWITSVVTRLGHHAVSTHSLRQGLRKAQSEPFDAVFIDVRLPDGSGLEMVPKFKAVRSSPEIIVITGLGHPDEAELAIKSGAWDYLEKPASFEAIKLPLIRALEYRSERNPGKLPAVLKRNGIIGDSPKIASCMDLLVQAASSDANVLITGETGTGKELFAKVIHFNSRRAKRNSSGSFKSAASVLSEDVMKSAAISGSWRRRTEISKTWSGRDGSGKISSSGSGPLGSIRPR
jgi:two-component system NtrC family response regulator